MAKIQTQTIVVTLNKLVKESDPDVNQHLVSDELKSAVEQIVTELADPGIVVEVQVVV